MKQSAVLSQNYSGFLFFSDIFKHPIEMTITVPTSLSCLSLLLNSFVFVITAVTIDREKKCCYGPLLPNELLPLSSLQITLFIFIGPFVQDSIEFFHTIINKEVIIMSSENCNDSGSGYGSGFALVVVLFILLIIIGASYMGGGCC